MTRRTAYGLAAAVLVILAGLVLLVRSSGPEAGPEPEAATLATQPAFAVRTIATGLEAPTWVGPAPGDDDALWVAERNGRVLRLPGAASGRELGEPQQIADIEQRVSSGQEQGLLAIAFLPDFRESREAVLSFTDRSGTSQLELWRLAADGSGSSERLRTLLTLDQPFPNHNGGDVAFGAHRTLYAGFGDGGGAGDPADGSQDPQDLHGKIVAVDLPGDVAETTGRLPWRVVATGLRNPWRFWFDPALGEMWLGDVGQDEWEEVDRIRLDPSEPPANLGWSLYEAHEPFRADERELRGTQELTWPVAAYRHKAGRCSVTGGLVYRGSELPALRGRYVFGDFCTGEVWSLAPGPGITAGDLRLERSPVPMPAHFGVDSRGELLVAGLDGSISRLVAPARG